MHTKKQLNRLHGRPPLKTPRRSSEREQVWWNDLIGVVGRIRNSVDGDRVLVGEPREGYALQPE